MNKDVNVVINDELNIRIDTVNYEYLDGVKKFFTEKVDGYMFSHLFKSGKWSGDKCIFSTTSRKLPYGLLFDLIRFTREKHPDVPFNIDLDVIALFKGIDDPDFTWNLKYYPRDYQEDIVRVAIKHRKGLIVSATASGKSLSIAYIIKELMKIDVEKSLIIVPTIGLVTQFYTDLLDYGIYEELLGQVGGKKKEFDKQIVISTWQSLKTPKGKPNPHASELKQFDCVIIDECHSASASVLHDTLKHLPNSSWRFGFTGTLPKCRLDELLVRSYIGPVLKTYTSKDLSDDGYISKCTINMMDINYSHKLPSKLEYVAVREEVFIKQYRIGLIKHICEMTDHTMIITIDKIKEGEILELELRERFPERQVVFISGKDSAEEREKWRLIANDVKDLILIATSQVIAAGVNIPSLKTVLLASASKSYIRIIQTIGRALRKHVDKEETGAIIWDLVDNVKYLKKHGDIRHRHYTFERHTINEYDVFENSGTYDFKEKIDEKDIISY